MDNKKVNVNVYIRPDELYTSPVSYILEILGKNRNIQFHKVNTAFEAQLVVDHEQVISIPIASEFYVSLFEKKIFGHSFYFEKDCMVLCNDGTPDFLATAFYMINCVQERNADSSSMDQFRRFKFEASYQYKFGLIEKNLVEECFDKFCLAVPCLVKCKPQLRKTKIFISHDIDNVHGAFLQDGLWALKKGRIDLVMKIILEAMLKQPSWKNMDKINKLHSEHDVKNTFFWIVNKNKGESGIVNADYSLRELKQMSSLTEINGLHKSTCRESFRSELEKTPFATTLNRFHFLKYTLPDAWDEISASSIKLDASLGFAEHYGFRNNYGLPFRPYNFSKNIAYDFVEVPLNLMDRTFHHYMKIPKDKTAETIISFIEANKNNCVLSLLWHNNYFTNYKYNGYLNEYVKVLNYLNEEGLSSICPSEIIKEYLE